MAEIKKVCVIGSGVMGSAIAAQIANAKLEVFLLDLPSVDGPDQSSIARKAKDRLLSAKPPPLSHFSNANYIHVGNLEHDLEQVKGCDLVIEVIIEKLEVKHQLYDKIVPLLSDHAILASNTSTLPLSALSEPLDGKIKERFYITHFFNPPRYMELLELVSPTKTNKDAHEALVRFLSEDLGKTVIDCNDTPGFIANRIGCFMLEMAVRKGIERDLSPSIIDKISRKLFGFPSTGLFGLYDLIGHDVMRLISESLTKELPSNDKYQEIYTKSSLLDKLIETDRIGRKKGAGFYRLEAHAGKKVKTELSLADDGYVDCPKYDVPDSVEELFERDDDYGNYFKEVIPAIIHYSLSLVPDVTDKPGNIDAAMRLGYSLKYGPFQLINKLPGGSEFLKEYSGVEEKLLVPLKNYKPVSRVYAELDEAELVGENSCAAILDHEQGVIFELRSKMGTLNSNVFELLIKAVDLAESKKKKLVICSAAKVFSAGADLRFFKEMVEAKDMQAISDLIKLGQKAMMRLKYANVATYTAVHALALGGGMEILLHAQNNFVHQNITTGLVEVNVGLIPGWGGTKEMLLRGVLEPEKLQHYISNIILSRKGNSAEYIEDEFGVNCVMVMNRNLLLKAALDDKNPHLPIRPNGSIEISPVDLKDGSIDLSALSEMQMDLVNFFQNILDEGAMTEEQLLEVEHDKFMQLVETKEAYEKIIKLC